MSYFFNKAEKDKIRGKDLKNLIEEGTNVLVYNGDRLYGVNVKEFYVNVLKGLPKKSEEKVVFVSENLDELQKLDDYDEYEIRFLRNGLEIWKKNPQNPADLVVFISGITL
jgi:hypothetical protein